MPFISESCPVSACSGRALVANANRKTRGSLIVQIGLNQLANRD
jgi:hypothetical protein